MLDGFTLRVAAYKEGPYISEDLYKHDLNWIEVKLKYKQKICRSKWLSPFCLRKNIKDSMRLIYSFEIWEPYWSRTFQINTVTV